MRKLNVLSLYDGMSCGLLGLQKAGVPVGYYGASEIDEHAIAVSLYRNPWIDPLGDVCNLKPEQFKDIDLIIGGSPCQSMSIAGKRNGMTTNKGHVVDSLEKYEMLIKMGYSYDKKSSMYFNSSTIFWEFIRLYRGIKKYNPNLKFFLENVISKEWEALITKELGVKPIRINSAVVIPQNRDRNYWTDIEYIPIRERGNYHTPDDPYIGLDYVIPDAVAGAGSRGVRQKNWVKSKDNPFLHKQKLTVRKDGLANCLTAGGGNTCRKYYSIDGSIKNITIEQAEMLQTVPVSYTNVPGISESQRFKMIGNGWTVDVIAHFFMCLKAEIKRKDLRFARTTIQLINEDSVLIYKSA